MVNKVILVGNLGREPDIKFTGDGKAIANLAVATSESWTDKNTQQKVEKTEWHRVVVFGKLGTKVMIQHTAKGKGKLVVKYNSLDELDGILSHIK